MADRILFVTRPITVYKTLGKKGKVDSPLIIGYAFDKLSESPLLPFEGLERKFRPFGQQGFISRGASDDVDEHVALVIWNEPDWDKKSFQDAMKPVYDKFITDPKLKEMVAKVQATQ